MIKMKPHMQLITMLKFNEDAVNTFVTTSSNIIISVSSDKSITLFDYSYKILQKIKDAHDGVIFDIALKDDNNFATCSEDKTIKTWVKSENNNYILNKTINHIHKDDIHKIEYLEDYTIISGSKDAKIKILNLINNEYKCTIILNNNSGVYSLLYLKEENILISTGLEYTRIWNMCNIINNLIVEINAFCHGKNALKRLDTDRIIVGGRFLLQIISLSQKKIINEIESPFLVWAICVIQSKNIFICGGVSNDMAIYNINNYEILGIVGNSHNGRLRGISLLNDGKIISGSEDKTTKIWEIIYKNK